MKALIHELQTVFEHGGVILWIMLGLSIILYSTLSSTWLATIDVQREFDALKTRLKDATSLALVEDEISLFHLDRMAWVKRRMPVISVLLALAPLSGLLGTVSGMLNTFAGLANETALKPIDSISSGISEALITTQVGLVIAVPGAFLYGFLKGRLGKISGELDQCAAHFTIKQRSHGG